MQFRDLRRWTTLLPAVFLLLAANPAGLRTASWALAPEGHRAPGAPKYAVATLVAGTPWVRGVRVLGCSLHELAQQRLVDMLAMCYNLTGAEVASVQAVGWKCLSPTQVRNPKKQWPWDFTLKIAPFGMTQYDRVLIIDSDTVVLRPQELQHLFEMPFPSTNIMAVPDCAAHMIKKYTPEQSSSMIQGGLLVIHPSNQAYESLKAAVHSIRSSDGGAQGFMSTYFLGNVTWLPAKFNYIRAAACVNLIDWATGYYDFGNSTTPALAMSNSLGAAESRARADIAQGNVVVAHFHFRPKPWDCDPQRPWKCGLTWAPGSTNVQPIYESWLQIDQHCGTSSRGTATLTR